MKVFKDKGYSEPIPMENIPSFVAYAKTNFTFDNKHNHTLVITGGQFVNDAI